MYAQGRGIERDDSKAREWWEKAAKQGFPPAQTGMGLLYTYGKNGVPHDDKKALEWFKKAAAQNEAFAQYNIAIAYGLGKGVPRDFDKHGWKNPQPKTSPPPRKC